LVVQTCGVPVVAVGQKALRWKKQLHDYFIPSFQEDNGSHLSVKNRYKATYIAAENASWPLGYRPNAVSYEFSPSPPYYLLEHTYHSQSHHLTVPHIINPSSASPQV
jgi:hypothetical protein